MRCLQEKRAMQGRARKGNDLGREAKEGVEGGEQREARCKGMEGKEAAISVRDCGCTVGRNLQGKKLKKNDDS